MVEMNKKESEPRYHTIAHEYLALNSWSSTALDQVLEEAAASIKKNVRGYAEEEAIAVTEKLEELLRKNPSYTRRGNIVFLNHQLRREKIFLANQAITYMAAAEALELPFAAVDGENILITWRLSDGTYFDLPVFVDDEKKDRLRMVEEKYESNVLYHDNWSTPRLVKSKVLSGYYSNIGIAWAKHFGAMQRAIICFEKALDLNPESESIKYNLDLARRKLQKMLEKEPEQEALTAEAK